MLPRIMNKIVFQYIIILAALFTKCSQTTNESTSLKTESVGQEKEVYTAANLKDSLVIDANENETNRLSLLKKLVVNEYNKIDYFIGKPIDSITISIRDSIRKFGYIVNTFPLEKIDSIEFYGIFNKQNFSPKHLQMNSLLIVYFNNFKVSRNELDSLEVNYRKNFKATESMFKPGGITFEIDNQLAIYSINTCSPGYKNLQRIDTLINKTIFKESTFTRLHAGCGMGPFKRIEK